MDDLGKILGRRISDRIKSFDYASPKFEEALIRIGILVQTQTKINIRRHHLIKTGTLFNSIKYELQKDGIEIGSYSVPYAAIHEFGYRGPMNIREHKRLQTKVWGRPVNPKFVNVREHVRQVNIRKRPYLYPALKTQAGRIVEILRSLVQ